MITVEAAAHLVAAKGYSLVPMGRYDKASAVHPDRVIIAGREFINKVRLYIKREEQSNENTK